LKQVPPQLIWPVGQPRLSVAQFPPKQIWPAAQALPQEPQFAGSVCASTQAPLQYASPGEQARARMKKQFPAAQPGTNPACPCGQTLPQVPQLFTSLCRSAQLPPQSVCPLGQVMQHVPAWQQPPAHMLAQVPQWFGSLERSPQMPPQQWPLEHGVSSGTGWQPEPPCAV